MIEDRIRMTLQEARTLVENVLAGHGLSAAHVSAVADVIMAGARLPSLRWHQARRRSECEGVHVPPELLDENYGRLDTEGASP